LGGWQLHRERFRAGGSTAAVNEIFPELAPAGTVIRIKFGVRTLKLATTPLIATAVVPAKWVPLHHERSADLQAPARLLAERDGMLFVKAQSF